MEGALDGLLNKQKGAAEIVETSVSRKLQQSS